MSDIVWHDALSYDNIGDLTYFNQCIAECLRIDPPIMVSSLAVLSEPMKIGPYNIRNDHPFYINLWALQHDPDEWPNPD